MPCNKILSLVIFIIHHFTTNRITVYMHVCRTHKNAYLQSFVLEIFFFHNFFYNYDLSICRANNFSLAFGKRPVRNTEKRDEEQKKYNCSYKNNSSSSGII